MQLRAREEEGFGLIELVIAMVVLNVGILALVGDVPVGRPRDQPLGLRPRTAPAVADKTMEVYRALQNKAIYLNAPSRRRRRRLRLPERDPEQHVHLVLEVPGRHGGLRQRAPTTTTRRRRRRRSG